jgi:alkylated DNA repair dioxygenase AlkB
LLPRCAARNDNRFQLSLRATRRNLDDRELMTPIQLSLLEPPPAVPQGFAYRPELVSWEEEAALIGAVRELPFREFEFHGFLGKRRTVSFGLRYDFADSKLHGAEPIPDFLLSLRERAAVFAGLGAAEIEHALVAEYAPGAAIGWHRDRPVFGDVIGVSFASACRFRFRRIRAKGAGWERAAVVLEPRSAYLLRGPARTVWEHSIPPADSLRYSVTFRTLRTR